MGPEEIAAALTEKASIFLASVGIASWWRTEDGERVPQSLIQKGLIERDAPGGIDFPLYRLTRSGRAVRDHLLATPTTPEIEP